MRALVAPEHAPDWNLGGRLGWDNILGVVYVKDTPPHDLLGLAAFR